MTSTGIMIREWRLRRRLSQLDLAAEAGISQRHLSFLESGRSVPSRDMAMRLAAQLEIPLRQRNQLLLAAGHAPVFSERKLDHHDMRPALVAVEKVLAAFEPNPAIAVDRHWNLVLGNRAIDGFLGLVSDPDLLSPPVNVLRLSLHPAGLAPHIVNLAAWRGHLLHRLARQNETHADPTLQQLETELRGYPGGVSRTPLVHDAGSDIAIPLRLRMGERTLSFISTITVFGTPLDVTLSELAVESFFPADAATADFLRHISAS